MNNLKNKKYPLVVIFGRANVGKSTLFNCLTEKKQALVSPIEGATRDSNIGQVSWRDKTFELIDTGGIMDLKFLSEQPRNRKKSDKLIEADIINIKVQQQAREYLQRADLILSLVDSKTGLLPQDKQIALFLKKLGKKNKILLVANKTDGFKERAKIAEFYQLSFGEPIPVSAATGAGTGDLLDIIVKKIPAARKTSRAKEHIDEEINPKSINVCIMGKPNVGKSSALNAILGYERVIVSPVPHTTREPQNTDIIYKEHSIKLIDTAGISKKGAKAKGLEKHGIAKSLSALGKADIALLVLDISQEITHQDAKLAAEIIDRRRSFIIIANKWDKIPEKDTKKYTNYIYGKLPFIQFASIQFVSALTGEKTNKILDLILKIAEQRQLQLSDSQLDKFLSRVVKIHRPAKGKGVKHPRIYEFKQTKSGPPEFELRIGVHEDLHFSYLRFIENRLREKFGFSGTPINIRVAKGRAVHGKHEQ
ncbi:ribosome biogenesis GTPase Der [Patescibacteria group bacterium]|nr:ribosome biogenesis GTPase Der [Patescibacteria group bacterium]